MRRAALRDRLDALRSRFVRSGEQVAASSGVDDALDRLDATIDRHFAKQAATRVTADRLVGALDVIPQGIVLADGDGGIVFRNRRAAGFLEARHGDALVGSLMQELIAAAADGASRTETIEVFGPPRRALQLRSVPVDGGDGHGAFLVVEDISERQHLEAVRRDFVANISHELRTPVGALGLLAETLAGEDDLEVVRHLAGRMQDEAFRVARTIDDLLQLSRIESAGVPEPEELAVGPILDEAVERTRAAAELLDVKVAVVAPAPELVVVGDRRQLVSAIANLCDNAAKYSDAGTAVVVQAARSAGEGEWIDVEVTDHGIGIPARDLERVFERFYRVDRARSRETGGTGLGLAIVRHVAQNHHGEVTVRSREGEGSTFTLRLPAAPAAGPPAITATPSPREPASTPTSPGSTDA